MNAWAHLTHDWSGAFDVLAVAGNAQPATAGTLGK
jgi:hypothetical protein